MPDSTPADIEFALNAAHAAKDAWGETSAAERARVLGAIADAIDAHAEMLAVTESWENGKPVRETLAADIPLAADHFRYLAAAIRAEEGTITEVGPSGGQHFATRAGSAARVGILKQDLLPHCASPMAAKARPRSGSSPGAYPALTKTDHPKVPAAREQRPYLTATVAADHSDMTSTVNAARAPAEARP